MLKCHNHCGMHHMYFIVLYKSHRFLLLIVEAPIVCETGKGGVDVHPENLRCSASKGKSAAKGLDLDFELQSVSRHNGNNSIIIE